MKSKKKTSDVYVFSQNGKTELFLVPPKFLSQQNGDDAIGGSKVVSPMPGILDKIHVKSGDTVKAGDPVAVIIAMKMEHVLKAPRNGVVKSVGGKVGDNLAKGAAVVTFEVEVEEK